MAGLELRKLSHALQERIKPSPCLIRSGRKNQVFDMQSPNPGMQLWRRTLHVGTGNKQVFYAEGAIRGRTSTILKRMAALMALADRSPAILRIFSLNESSNSP